MNQNAEIFFENIKNKKIAFIGLGVSHIDTIKLFLDKGIDVLACDQRTFESLDDNAKELEKLGAKMCLGDDYNQFYNADIIFRTPGMYFYKDELSKLREMGKTVTSELEVFLQLCNCKTIGVTGSDGKTTTSSLIAEILNQGGYTVHLGGNIGRALLPMIFKIKSTDIAVIELSSFQLLSFRNSPDIAVITNLSPNHLDVHKDMEEYVGSKINLILHQNGFSKTILNYENKETYDLKKFVRGELVLFNNSDKIGVGSFLNSNRIIYYKDYETETELFSADDMLLPGEHNVENMMTAIAATYGLVDNSVFKNVAQTFSGVKHRLEFVRELDSVKYYNDSIATTPTRAIAGLKTFNQKIILIAGGYDKNLSFEPLAPLILEKVKVLILMGDTAEKIKQSVEMLSDYTKNKPSIIMVNNMEEAVEVAHKKAISGDIVSLSPSCASFNLYKNFEKRGEHFKDIVKGL